MDREEFIRRWNALPDLKKAELIEGTVFVPSPLGDRHSDFHTLLTFWLRAYANLTPGVKAGNNATYYMLESSPQPDGFLRVREEFGGSSRVVKNFLHGAPELAVEIRESSTDYDYGPKLALYQRAGVQEYITLDTFHRWFVWRVLVEGSYRQLELDEDGTFRSRAFPGLWLSPEHFWADDGEAMRLLVEQGVASPEHAAFVASLREKASKDSRENA
jgi:Uma2 family endonuclease